MIKDAKAYSVSNIFTRENKWFYEIPIFQRAYTWGQKEWTTLFDDLVDNDMGYFLGSIICVNNSKSTIINKVDLQIIDGQQRVTSLSILLLAIYDKIKYYEDVLSENQLDKLKDIKKGIVALKDEDDNEEYKTRLSLQIQESNNDDYLALLGESELLEHKSKPKNAGNRRIYKAYKTFLNAIENYIVEEKSTENQKEKIKALFYLANKVNSAVLVFIEVDTNKDAYMLFESLNNRGIPLSAIDLLKNYLISIADDKLNHKVAEKAYKQWERIIDYLGDNYSDQERFMRQYYNAFREEINSPYRTDDSVSFPIGYLATKSTLLEIYEKMIKSDWQEFLNILEEKSRIYSILINKAKDNDVIDELKDSLLNLERIQGAPSYILLLFLVSNKDSYNLSYSEINYIINYLVKFFVRRNLTDYPNTRNLTKIFMDTVAIIRDNPDNISTLIFDKLKSVSSSDTEFINKLKDDIYLNNVDSTRFLLCYYEEKYKTNEIHTDLWNRDKNNKYIWTIEHIFPEGDNVPESWVNMIAGGNKETAAQYREQYTHKLGNLTITGYNQNLSNLSFDDKKTRKKDGKDIGYKNGLKLNVDVVDNEEWKIDNIKIRTEKFIKFFSDEFEL